MTADAWREELRQIIREVVVEVVAELRDQDAPQPKSKRPGLLTARETASALGLSLTFLRERRDELGVITFGSGEKARLYFPRSRIEALIRGDLAIHAKKPELPQQAKPRKRRPTSNVPLLEIKGEAA